MLKAPKKKYEYNDVKQKIQKSLRRELHRIFRRKNTIREMKKSLDGVKSRLEET